MKRRYLFPLLYVIADAFAMLFLSVSPLIPSLISSISFPSSFILRIVSRILNAPSDPAYFAYFVGVGTILQMFLLGLVFELLANKIRTLVDRKRVVA